VSEIVEPEKAPAPEQGGAAPGRPRGRRPASGRDTKATIVHAATEEFAASGYDSVSLRSIARRAGVDPALVHHYFADKADLFAATIDAPVRPDQLLHEILAGAPDEIGERIVRRLLVEWDKPEVRKRGVLLIRGVLGQSLVTTMVRQFLVREVIHRIASALNAPDADLRAQLAASQLVGLLAARYLLELPEVKKASVEELVARVGPVVQWYLAGSALP
jgi:AcrR family transcriptional regulator